MNNSTNTTANIVHESETQRQYIRVKLPVKLEINGVRYDTTDWSAAGLAISVTSDSNINLQPKHIYQATLIYEFENFSLSVPIELEVLHIDSNSGRIGCRFQNITPQQQSIIQYMVSAYISGELVQAGDILNIVARNNHTNPRKIPEAKNTAGRKIANYGRIALLTIIAALLIFVIATGIYERLFIIKTNSAQVVAEQLVVDLPKSGRINYRDIAINSQVKYGEPLLAITTSDGNIISLNSPCDCIIKRRLLTNGRKASKGEAAFILVHSNANPYIEGYINNKDATRISTNHKVIISLPGATNTISGKIIDIRAAASEAGKPVIVVQPDISLPASTIDDPAEVKIDILGLL